MGKEKPVEGKFVTSVKVGPKGQIIVPKEVRDMFNIQPGDMLLMLADVEQGTISVVASGRYCPKFSTVKFLEPMTAIFIINLQKYCSSLLHHNTTIFVMTQ